jgi:hypothetical protein
MDHTFFIINKISSYNKDDLWLLLLVTTHQSTKQTQIQFERLSSLSEDFLYSVVEVLLQQE